MTALFDSCILIDALKGNSSAVLLCKSFYSKRAVSVVTIQEIFTGVREHEVTQVEQLFDTFELVSVDPEVARLAGELMQKYFHSHGVRANDAFIAATAMIYGYELKTLNLKHFPMLPNLERPY